MKQASRPLVASDSVSLPPAVPANTGWSDGEKKLADFPRCKMTLMAHSDRFCAATEFPLLGGEFNWSVQRQSQSIGWGFEAQGLSRALIEPQGGDWEAAGNLLRIFGMQTETLGPKTLEGHKAHFIAGHGGYPLVGTAGQIADELCKLADIGVDGCLISWVDYKNELKQWNAEVLPLLEKAGLRQPFRPAEK